MHQLKVHIVFLSAAICLTLLACSPRALHEAQGVVAQADSLRAEGQMYSDSIQLAYAYVTLDKWQLLYPTDYAHSCYHYGRLLRESDNPVDAMKCFINATHTRTHDYHVLGRIYSNIGDLCHLTGEYSLSYDMFEQSANMFLKNGDTINYYYALNDMAFELAEQGKKNSSNFLIQYIKEKCVNKDVLTKTLETQVVACKKTAEYDSVLFYTAKLLQKNNCNSYALLNRAQAYSFIGEKDSAVYYAHKLLTQENELFTLNSALYILTNDDDSKDKESIRATAANRADTQKIIEIQQGKLSKATQLLEQDIHREPNLTWLYTVCLTLSIIGLISAVYIHKKRQQRTLLSQQIDLLADSNNETLQKHEQIIKEHNDYRNTLVTQLENRCSMFFHSKHIKNDLCWSEYTQMSNIINQQFFFFIKKLQNTQPLNEKEIRYL